ncbi:MULTISPECIES: invasion associated locus B family protein [unclassified Modicisalibacter]|uniref:invasion associated locus B family protein n=1 Tax=unclassified Modicisalibacter TaxID=2679913 RepID=UPI001CCD31AA|nr:MULTISPECIES: invasion associated locus B family protein [unclassified Modicisalibacter]MBZ9560117.1 invasion associated locus B family protein [Modicisalibacter sp. R2A 31.J]MBZ9576025.1 invasion associated locus B family protein [Modicisalibacter sp. MOD 31.J]
MLERLTRRLLATALILMAVAPVAFAQQQGANGANVKTQRFQDWEVRCPTDPTQGNCTMTQLIDNPGGNEPVMRVVIAYPPQIDGPAMVFLLPLGVRLAPGLQLTIDNSKPLKFPYQVCVPDGCRADIPVKPELLNQLRSGSKATVSLIGPDGQRMDLDISLMGFTDASQRIAR